MNRKEKLNILLNELRRYDNEYGTFLEQDCLNTLEEGDYSLEDYIHCMKDNWISDWLDETYEDEINKKNALKHLQNVLATLEE